MSCCRKAKVRRDCPECGDTCLGVSLTTMRHHVQFPDNQYISEGEYSFCSNQQCRVGYFSLANIIPKEKLRVFKPKTNKHEALLCYCFDISQACYQAALAAGDNEPIKEFVTQQTKLSACACEIRNPSGKCCLANFKQLEKIHTKGEKYDE